MTERIALLASFPEDVLRERFADTAMVEEDEATLSTPAAAASTD